MNLAPFGKLATTQLVAAGALATLIYFLPTVLAYIRRHPARNRIAATNLATGWTWVGWLAVMAWAAKPNVENPIVAKRLSRRVPTNDDPHP